jgi:hypothetical protein
MYGAANAALFYAVDLAGLLHRQVPGLIYYSRSVVRVFRESVPKRAAQCFPDANEIVLSFWSGRERGRATVHGQVIMDRQSAYYGDRSRRVERRETTSIVREPSRPVLCSYNCYWLLTPDVQDVSIRCLHNKRTGIAIHVLHKEGIVPCGGSRALGCHCSRILGMFLEAITCRLWSHRGH